MREDQAEAPSASSPRRAFYRRRLDEAALGEFLDVVYAAATKPDEWSAFFEKVRHFFGGYAAIYERSADNPETHQLTATNLDPDFRERYNVHYNATNVWATSPLNQASPIVLCDEIIDPSLLETTEFYGDWLQPQQLKFAMTCQLKASGNRSVNLGFVREERLGNFEDHERHFLGRLLPHLHRAAEIKSRIEGAAVTARSSLAALEHFGLAAILVDSDSRILFANSTAEVMFRTGETLLSRSGRLVGASETFPRLGAAIQDATRAKVAVGSIVAPQVATGGKRSSLAITPLEAGVGSFLDEPLALVFVSSADQPKAPSRSAMRSYYGFTEAEANLAAALCSGGTLAEYAASRGVSVVTVKSHLAALFAKTGANRQADLLRILLTDPLLLTNREEVRRSH